MNGADILCESLMEHGIDTCFANPGTSEMHFVAALDRRPELRCVLGLSEGVVTGAADGYARMADKPAATLLHCGPGLANGLANLHNARRARTPVLNVVGDHASYHLENDPPLASDIETLARPMSEFVRRIAKPESIRADVSAAYAAAISRQGVATLVLPGDAAWKEAGPSEGEIVELTALSKADRSAFDAALSALRSGRRCTLLLGTRALRKDALDQASLIAAASGARLMSEPSNGRIEHHPGHAPLLRMPYFVDDAVASFRDVEVLILVGARRPTAFFAYPGKPLFLHSPETELINLGDATYDLLAVLTELAGALPAKRLRIRGERPVIAAPSSGVLTEAAISRIVAAGLPENAIICDESITSCREFFGLSQGGVPYDYLQLTGGAIGIGIPLAAGAAIACPGRKVIGLQADGSAMYTVQGLWTQAREELDVVTIILSNRAYAILQGEMQRVGVSQVGRNAKRMLDLDAPPLDWVAMAKAHGVEGRRATTVEEFRSNFAAAVASRGPVLIEAVL